MGSKMGTIKYMTDNGQVHVSVVTAHQVQGKGNEATIRYVISNGSVYSSKEVAITEQRLIELTAVLFNEQERNFWYRVLGADKLKQIMKKIIERKDGVIEVLTEEF